MLVAEGEIGAGRDISTIVPGGFTSSGALNGNLRPRAAELFLYGALGKAAQVPADAISTPNTEAYDTITPNDTLPFFTIEKKVGTSARTSDELLTVQMADCVVNTVNIAANSGALSTFSASVITAGEEYIDTPIVDDTASSGAFLYDVASNDLLVFHGGRVQIGDTGGSLVKNEQFMSLEVVINNNMQADEWTIRPSRFLHSVTEGIRAVETNMTIVFNDHDQYQKYTYGASGDTSPGYSLYQGQLDFTLANWQLADADIFSLKSGSTVPTSNAQAVHMYLPTVVFAGFPVALASGRIVVSTSGRAVKPVGSTDPIVTVDIRPTGAGFTVS